MTNRACTFLRCTRKPTHVVYPAYGRPWFGCSNHYPDMAKALSVGNPDSRTSRVLPIAKRTRW